MKCHILISLCLVVVFAAPSFGQEGRDQIRAVSGTGAPEGNGVFSTFSEVLLNDDAAVSFAATLLGSSGGANDDQGIYLADSGGLFNLARTGQSADANGVFAALTNFGLNAKGQSLFHAQLTGTASGGNDDSALYLGSSASLTQLVREGQATPSGNGSFGNLAIPIGTTYGFNNAGTLGFANSLAGTDQGSANNFGLFATDGVPVEKLREGDTVPNGLGKFIQFNNIRLNDVGQLSFHGSFGTSSGGMFRHDGDSIATIFVSGDSAPDGNGTIIGASGQSDMNKQGQVAVAVDLANVSGGLNSERALVRGDGNTLVQIVRGGQSAAGNGGFSETQFASVRINDRGEVGFSAKLANTTGGGGDNTGIYRSSSSGTSLVEIARQGDQISTGDGVLGDLFTNQLALNDSGVVAFQSLIHQTQNEEGIFIGDGTELLTVAQKGQSLNGSTIESLDFRGGIRHQNGLNSFGQVAYAAKLVNGQEVVNTWTPDLKWRAGTNGQWEDAGAWTLRLDPTEVHRVIIDAGDFVEGPTIDTHIHSLQVGGGAVASGITLQAGTVLSVDALSRVSNRGRLDAQGGSTFDGDLSILNGGNMRIAEVGGSGTFNVTGNLSSAGNIQSAGVNTLQIEGALRLNNGSSTLVFGNGSVHSMSGTAIRSGAVLRQAGTGRATFQGDVVNEAEIIGSWLFTDRVENSGTIRANDGNISFSGRVVQNGIMDSSSGGFLVDQDGFFSGDGGMTGGGALSITGRLLPGRTLPGSSGLGNDTASISIEGDLRLFSTAASIFQLGGTNVGEFDQVTITQDLSLSGRLTTLLVDGFALAPDQRFTIFDVAGVRTGQFTILDEGDFVDSFNGTDLFITYNGGDGNDVVLFTEPLPPGPVWVGGTGNWHDSQNWENGFPSLGSETVLIDNGSPVNSVVSTLGQTPIVQGLQIDAGDTLIVERSTSGNLVFDMPTSSDRTAASLVNNGLVIIDQNDSIIVDAPQLDITGNGTIRLDGSGSGMRGNDNKLVNGAGHRIEGQGRIQFNDFDNLGTVIANGTARLEIAGSGSSQGFINNTGTLRAEGGSELRLNVLDVNGGVIEADGAGSRVFINTTNFPANPATSIRNSTFRTTNGGVIVETASAPLFLQNVTNEGAFSGQHVRLVDSFHNTGQFAIINSFNDNISLANDVTITGNGVGTLEFTQGGLAFTEDFHLSIDGNRIFGIGTIDTASLVLGDNAVLDPFHTVNNTRREAGVFEFLTETTFDGSVFRIDMYGDQVAPDQNTILGAPNENIANVFRDISFPERGLNAVNMEYDQLNIYDTLTLAGDVELEISLIDGFAPEDGDFFDVLTADQLILGNDFNLVLNAPVIDGKTFGFEILNLPDNGAGFNRDVLRLSWGVQAVPEPAFLPPMIALLLAMFVRRGRALKR